MCMLSILPPGITCDEFVATELINGCMTNRDGFGWAVISRTGEMLTGKSMDAGEAIEGFTIARARNPQDYALFHSRWATHGMYGIYNVHPFILPGDSLSVVAHNGIMPRSFHPKPGDPRSDTRKFVDALPHIGHLDSERTFQNVRTAIGGGNKVAVLTANPDYQRSLYLWGETSGDYSPKTTVWHSNWDYLGNWGMPTHIDQSPDSYQRSLMGTFELPDNCPVCRESDIDPEWRICNVCAYCFDCYEFGKDCVCFTGGANRRATDGNGNWWNDSDEYVMGPR